MTLPYNGISKQSDKLKFATSGAGLAPDVFFVGN